MRSSPHRLVMTCACFPLRHQAQSQTFCVLDTGCQRSAVGSQTLRKIQDGLPEGMNVRREEQTFFFKGVGGTTRTHQVAVIPICLGSRPAFVQQYWKNLVKHHFCYSPDLQGIIRRDLS